MPDKLGGRPVTPEAGAPGDVGAPDDAAASGGAADAGHSQDGDGSSKLAGVGARWRLRNWRLRPKLAAVLIIPTLTALALGSLSALGEANRAAELQQTVQRIDLAGNLNSAVHQLQGERTLAVGTIASDGRRKSSDLEAQMAKVDDAVRRVRAAAGSFADDDQEFQDRYRRGLQRLDALEPLREAIRTTEYSDLSTLGTYTSIIETLVQLGREVNTSITDRGLLRLGSTTQALSEGKEYLSRENAALQIAAWRNAFPADLLYQARAAEASSSGAIDSFIASASPEQQRLYSDTVSGPAVDDRERIESVAFVRADEEKPLNIPIAGLTTNGRETVDKMREVERTLHGNLRAQAAALAQDATNAAWQFGIIVAVAVVAALVWMLIIARSLLRPLRVLRSNALEVAYVRLPETVRRILADPNPMEASKNAVAPVPVISREEIGEVARSFDVVHERALRMAAEQALLRENVNNILVNLSRRSQRLVERQLGVIDQMEAEEQDPDQLASLFELDHLATRLRRNGESLLVLSGAGLGKSMLKPVPAADVIGAAVSEIEQYARVEVGSLPEVTVQGLTVRDLVHVLAELLDNATHFSNPVTKVDVRAVITRRRTLAIQITDRGVGMSEDQIEEANERLADPPDLDVSVTRQMGLYVVARLAQRHDIEVRVRDNEDDLQGGLIARIVVPTELLGNFPLTEPMPQLAGAVASHGGSAPPSSALSASGSTGIGWPTDEPAASVSGAGVLPVQRRPTLLDDLVGGSARAAGPFASPAPAEPDLTQSDPNQRATRSPVPTDLPQRVPVTARKQVNEVPDEDVPTKRLPIYQSVMSRWFSEPGEELSTPESTPESKPEAGTSEPSPQLASERSTQDNVRPEWASRSDNGWKAAQALLESKSEEITSVGLPKRVPNANLVPGSAHGDDGGQSSAVSAFADTTTGISGDSARSAAAARSRMVSFQRGYQNGRHALQENGEREQG